MGQAGAERSQVTRGAKSRAGGWPRPGYLIFLPAIMVPSLAWPEFAVAKTLGVSFLGLFVAFVLFLGHVALPVCAGKAAKGAGRARKTSGAGRWVCGRSL
jgi:hypothetical protein